MMRMPIGTVGGRCSLVSDGDYPDELLRLIREAHTRCLVSMFIIDSVGTDRPLERIVLELQAASWRGLDVRVLLGGSRQNLAIAETGAGSSRIFRDSGIASRWLGAKQQRGSHAKVVVIDDAVLVGSHNWSAGAFSGQHQDSVLVRSQDLSSFLSGWFNEQWQAGEGR